MPVETRQQQRKRRSLQGPTSAASAVLRGPSSPKPKRKVQQSSTLEDEMLQQDIDQETSKTNESSVCHDTRADKIEETKMKPESNRQKSEPSQHEHAHKCSKYKPIHMYVSWFLFNVGESCHVQLKHVALVSLLFLLLGIVFSFVGWGDVPSHGSVMAQDEFMRNVQRLKNDFPSQEESMWDMVEATVGDHLGLDSEPERPIVLLFASLPDASNTTKCLIGKLVNFLSGALGGKDPRVAWIDGRDFENKDADDAKFELDERLTASFDKGQKAAVILNLDALPPCSILLFHSYCENENARYKDAALIFTVTLRADQSEQLATRSKPLSIMSEVAFQVSEHLTRTWVNKCPKLPEEKVDAMLSRIANNVDIVKKEQVERCK